MSLRKFLGALLALLTLCAWPALAQGLLLGVGGYRATGGVAPVAYNPLGVLIQQDVAIGTDSALNTTNSKNFIVSFWINGNDNLTTSNLTTIVNAGPIIGNKATSCEVTAGTHVAPTECISFDNPAHGQFNFNNSVGTTDATDSVRFVANSTTAAAPNNVWNHYLITGNTLTGNGAVVLNGVNVMGSLYAKSTFANTTPDFSSGGIHLLNGGTNPVVQGWGYMSDLYINSQASMVCTGAGAPATMFGTAVTCAAADTVPPEMIARLYSSGPVDPGTNCTTVTGAQPEVCFKAGTSGTSGMTTNLGTATPGVAIAPVVLTTGGSLFPAPYGPAGIPAHQATLRWLQDNPIATVTSNAMTTDAAGAPIAVGDLIVIAAEFGNNSAVPTGGSCPTGGANTWHQVGPVADTFEDVKSFLCWTIVQTGDTGGAWTVSWTSAPDRTHGWAMADYANVASVDQSGSRFNSPSTTSHATAAGLTTTSANETVVSIWTHWEANTGSTTFNFPAGVNGRFRQQKVGAYAMILWGDEYAVASGSNPQRTVTTSSGDTSAGFTLTLVPN